LQAIISAHIIYYPVSGLDEINLFVKPVVEIDVNQLMWKTIQ